MTREECYQETMELQNKIYFICKKFLSENNKLTLSNIKKMMKGSTDAFCNNLKNII